MSTIKANTLSNVAGSQSISTDRVAQGTAFAWVNFNGTGTVAIRASYNVSSITDNGTGDYTVNFTSAAVDANYTPVFSVVQNATNGNLRTANVYGSDAAAQNKATGSFRMTSGATNANQLVDLPEINAVVFR